ncbi:metallophosphoesterase family protein [Candidiatus Paracoxiella cheracis]|uniref:metallophosphoesterase family protein n=1 Tax=Candidiatus Paracoxiella cheracis TaxID=3405120 RepID=UPI003BF45DEC
MSDTVKIPATTRVYAIADMHGRADLLARLLRAISKDAASHTDQRRILITLGDYIDRGANSNKVIETLIELPLEDFEAKHLKGNHEEMLLDFLDDPLREGVLWLSNGGWATLISYGLKVSDLPEDVEDLPVVRDKLLAVMPKEHLSFFKSLRLFYQLGDYYFVHAGVRPGVALDKQKEDDLLWIRDEFLFSDKDFGKVVVHGHSISREPKELKNRIGLDTGAFHTGTMTCLVLNGEERYFLQVKEGVPQPIKLQS